MISDPAVPALPLSSRAPLIAMLLCAAFVERLGFCLWRARICGFGRFNENTLCSSCSCFNTTLVHREATNNTKFGTPTHVSTHSHATNAQKSTLSLFLLFLRLHPFFPFSLLFSSLFRVPQKMFLKPSIRTSRRALNTKT